MDDPFGPSSSSSSSNTVNNNNMTQSSASTSYTIMSPRAFASSPLLPTLLQKGSPIAAGAGATGSTSTSNASPGHQLQSSNSNSSIPISNMNISSPSSIMRPVSPPTPAPSPQPELEHGGIHAHVLHDGTAVNTGSAIQSNAASISTPLHPGSVLMAHSGSAAMGEPGTPVSPGTEDAPGLAWGNPNIHVHPSHFSLQEHDDDKQPAELNQHIDPVVQEALFVTQYIQSVVSYFPRLTGSERRTLFNSLLPYMAGEDLLYLSHLISPYLRRDFLAELPAEIALKILTFIDDPKDLVRASCVSRTWRSLVADEQNWKLMLEKYNGGNWTEARPALATTGIPSTSQADAVGGRKTASSGRQQRQFVHEQTGLAGFSVPRLNSAISPTCLINPAVNATAHLPGQRLANDAPASRSNIRDSQPSYHHTRNAFYNLLQGDLLSAGLPGFDLLAPSSASSSTSHPMVAGASTSSSSSSLQPEDGREINRFLDENQTPLAERVRRNKGKGRALENAEDQPFARDLSSDGAMPGPSRVGTVGLVQMPVLDPIAARRTPVGKELHGLGVLPPRMGSVSGSSVVPPQPSPSAAAVLAAHQQQLSRQQARSAASTALPPPNAMLYPIPQSLAGQMQQLSLAGAVPPTLPTLPVLDSNANRSTQSANTVPSTVSSAISPSATFQPAYVSPAQYAPSTFSSTPSVPFANRGAPSIIAADQTSPIFSRRPSYALPNQSQSAPQPARSRIAKSQNPFGTAQTNLSYTAQYSAGYSNVKTSAQGANSAGKPFSYKTQFKKAYLTESNWLKGPGRVLSRQTCTDDGVVTSLGFDNEWIIVGMATNQIHVFDAKTGAYVQQLVGHSLGVWCLVLVSKGGQRVDKDGKKIKIPNLDDKTIPDVFRLRDGTSWEPEEVEDDSGSQDSSDEVQSPTMSRTGSSNLGPVGMERTRSASARPADRERFFQEASDSLSSSPSLLEPNDGSPRSKGKSRSRARRMSGEVFSSEAAKPKNNRRPSSFCGVPSSGPSGSQSSPSNPAGFASNPSGFPFGGDGTNISPQQAAACGTAQGWGQPGAVAVSGGCDRDVRVWDVATGRCIHLLRGHMSTVRCLKVLDGRPIAVSGSRDNTLRVWDIERGVLLHMLSGHQHSVRCIEISGNKVVSGSYDATCKVWDVDTGECLHTLQGHQHQIYAVAFDGNRVASGSLDSTVRIWSAKTGECLALLQGHTSLVGQLQLTDSLLVTGGSDGRVIVFSLSTFECLHRLCAHDNSVTCLQFNDRFMVTGGNDGRVKLWDRPSGKLIRDLAEPCEAVWRVTFREDKFVLLCKRGNRTIMEVRTFAPFEEEL